MPSGPPSARSAATDTLESARDEIRGLKAGRDARGVAEGGLPRIAAPEWHGGAVPAPPARPVQPNPAAGARNPNWLMDALQQPDAGGVRARDREDARGGRTGERITFERTDGARSRSGQAPGELRGAAERSPPDRGQPGLVALTNPLTVYLDDWMTPQDFALLKPGLDGRPAAALPLGNLGAAPGGFPSGLPPGPMLPPGAAAVPVVPATGGLGVGRENPFLAALNAPAAAGMAATPPVVSSPAPRPGTVTTPPAVPPPATPPVPRVPEFARPTADEKHFKPLKRF